MTSFFIDDEISTEAQIDKEMKKFNWGAFLLGWIWGVGNSTYNSFVYTDIILTVLGFMPIKIPFLGLVSLGLHIYMGIKGNEWALENKEWLNLAQFTETQKKWVVGAFAFIAIMFFIGILGGLLFGGMMVKVS